jgi:hypothetical protein
MRAAFRTLL